MAYPDTTRTVLVGIETTPGTAATVLKQMHTMNEPAHTLANGMVVVRENTGTRVNRSGQARGRRSSTIRIQAYVRLQELGTWLESAIAEGVTVPYPDRTTQTVAITGSPTGGTFTLEVEGQVTTPLAFGAAAGVVQAALEALPNLGVGEVTVSGSGPYTITFPNMDPGAAGPTFVVGDARDLTGGTNPAITATSSGSITDAYLRTYKGGVARGRSLTIVFYNGLYWRRMVRAYVNTMNIQGFGDNLAMIDMEIVSKASVKIVTPATIPPLDDDYVPMDVPMQSVRFGGLTNADVLNMAVNINNNLATRSPMDGSTSIGRVRWGFFEAGIDGRADYPAYEGSLYEIYEAGGRVAAMDLLMMDDLHTVGTGTPINPYALIRVPQPVLEDTGEGDDGGELIQIIRGGGELDVVEACAVVIELVNDKPATYYAAS